MGALASLLNLLILGSVFRDVLRGNQGFLWLWGPTTVVLGGLLGGARGASDVARPRSEGFDPGDAIGTVAAELSSRYAAAGVSLEVRVPPLLPAVRGREDLLIGALTGLLEVNSAANGESTTISRLFQSSPPNS